MDVPVRWLVQEVGMRVWRQRLVRVFHGSLEDFRRAIGLVALNVGGNSFEYVRLLSRDSLKWTDYTEMAVGNVLGPRAAVLSEVVWGEVVMKI
jgi:hypothetical protein